MDNIFFYIFNYENDLSLFNVLTTLITIGAYMARRIAVDYLKERKAKEVYVHIAYAIGVAEPLMATVTIDGIQEEIEGYDLKPKAIIEYLDLRKPKFREMSKYGHFGNGFI